MTTSLIIPPALIMILAGLLLPVFERLWLRSVALLVAPLAALMVLWSLPEGVLLTMPYLGYDLVLVKIDNLTRVFASVFLIMAFAGGLFALNQKSTLELAAAFVYAGSAVGVAMAGDLITVFVFWELMAVASTIVVWCGGEGGRRAGMRYAIVHMFGGVLLMAGIAGEIASSGTAVFREMDVSTVPRMLMIAGVLVNIGAPPLWSWIGDAYPESSWSGMVFLSAFTTKTAVYVLMRGFPGTEFLVYIGLFMVFYGIVFAILENDMRRILAYSIVNQVGFMVTGIGIGTQMALNGAAAHAFAHIIYKALLLMSAGSVLYMTGKRKCTDLGGLFRTMPLTCACGIIGALSISAFPATSGFISKSMISQAAADQHLAIVWFLLAAASAGVFLHAGIKFPWFVFFQKDSGLRPDEPPLNMRVAMVLLSAICIGLGVYPDPLYAILPYPVAYVPYTGSHVVFQLQLLLFSGLAFFLMLAWLQRTMTITLDIDWFWRRPGRWIAGVLDRFSGYTWEWMADRVVSGAVRAHDVLYRSHGPKGLLGRTLPTGQMALWTTIVLGAVVILAYI